MACCLPRRLLPAFALAAAFSLQARASSIEQPEPVPAVAVATAEDVADMPAAQAALLSTREIERMLEIARGYGEAEVTETQEGDPVIMGDLNGIAYQLFFLDCASGASGGCRVLNFYAIWDVPTVSVGAINAWNRTNPFHKSYITEDNLPVVELNLSAPGSYLTEAQLEDAYSRFTVALASFEAEVIAKTP